MFLAYAGLGTVGIVVISGRLIRASGEVGWSDLPLLGVLVGLAFVLISSTACGLLLIVTDDRGYIAAPGVLLVYALVWWLATKVHPAARICGEALFAVHFGLALLGTWYGDAAPAADISDPSDVERR